MQCVQNYAARIVTGIQKYDHITPCLKELKWLPVSKELYLRDAVMTFKYIKGTAPTYLTPHFRSRLSISGRTTRQSNDIQIPKCRTATGQSRLLAEHRSVIWNSLCPSLKQVKSAKVFKNCLKKQLLEIFLDTN
jgi:hypothetical protein